MAGQSSVTVKIEGVDNLIAKMRPAIAGRPIRRFFERSAIVVRNQAVSNVAVFDGRLKGNIAWELDAAPLPLWARVGTNVEYGRDIEFGTEPHFVPPTELDRWARIKDIKGGGKAVSDHIMEYGTNAQPFLYPAMQDNEGTIRGFIPVLAKEIEDAFSRG